MGEGGESLPGAFHNSRRVFHEWILKRSFFFSFTSLEPSLYEGVVPFISLQKKKSIPKLYSTKISRIVFFPLGLLIYFYVFVVLSKKCFFPSNPTSIKNLFQILVCENSWYQVKDIQKVNH